MASSSSSSSCRNWSYDVFPSFSGEDVRKTFLSHFLKELDRKLIIAFKDNEIERSRSLDPELRQAIKDSRIAVVIFSKKYASSSWCLNELLEIVKCKKECGQMVIPVFYGLDPSHVRKQTGDFGEIFEKTCQNKTEDEMIRWRGALTDVANILGYHTMVNEARLIEEIANDVLEKLNINPSDEFEDYVGIEDHFRAMSSLLHLESEEVRMVGIWGSSGIGKTTIARALYNRLSRQFQSSVFIDKVFISKSMEVNRGANLGDYNMKLHLQRTFLAKILDKSDIKIDHIGAVEKMLKHRKTLIFIDDLDDQDVLDALVGKTHWFGIGSRIIVVTKDKHFLRAHAIDHIYEVCLPNEFVALEMFCRSAFRMNYPPDDFVELASEVVLRAGNLPLGLKVLGSSLRGRDKEDWLDMLPRLQSGLDGKIEKTLRLSYDGLNNKKDEAIFRHIACLFNGEEVDNFKLLLADSNLDVDIGLKNLIDKSLIHETWNTVEMHSLLQEMGREIVRSQSDEPGKREFLIDSKDICDVLENNTGTKSVLGIVLNMDYTTDELQVVNESAFKEMRNLRFLEIFGNTKRLQLHKRCVNYLSPKLKSLCWSGYPMRCMPSKFRPENLVKLQMRQSNLEKLWEGVVSLTSLKKIDLVGSENLKEIPDLSKATNLEILVLAYCSRLLELTSSIRNLKKLRVLDVHSCKNLKTIPTGIYLKYLHRLDLRECFRLRGLPGISEQLLTQKAIGEFPSSNLHLEPFISLMTTLLLGDIPNLVELPSSYQYLHKLKLLEITYCQNLETLPTGIDLYSLEKLDLTGCSRLRTFPNISRAVLELDLEETSIEEIPWWIENFPRLSRLNMSGCKNLVTLPTGLNLQALKKLNLRGCSRLRTFPSISRNVEMLDLRWTAIEKVPWWIEKFSRLTTLFMGRCYKLRRVSLNILKLKYFWWGDFSNCGALTEVGWDESPSVMAMATDNIHPRLPYEVASHLPEDYISTVKLDFIKCLNLDPKVLLQQKTVCMRVTLSGEEVPSYFTQRTTGTFLTNILLPDIYPSQPFLRFKVCAMCDVKSYTSFGIQVCFRFIDISGKHFDYVDLQRRFETYEVGGHLVLFDCCFPLNKDITPLTYQLYYGHMDIQFCLIGKNSKVQLKGCGIQLLENGQTLDN